VKATGSVVDLHVTPAISACIAIKTALQQPLHAGAESEKDPTHLAPCFGVCDCKSDQVKQELAGIVDCSVLDDAFLRVSKAVSLAVH
jgi:hypothetical protein